MRLSLMLFLYVLLLKYSFAQEESIHTSITIIGTIHTGNKHFSHKELFNDLKSIKPDIILWEHSVLFKKVFGLRTGHFLQIFKPSIEQLALQKYTAKYGNCVVLPFDTIIPERLKYKRDLQVKHDLVFNTLLKVKLPRVDSIALSSYIVASNSYYGMIPNKSLKDLNEKNIIDKSRKLDQIETDSINQLVKRYCPDSLLLDWYLNNQIFWELRNQYMAR